jgi:hypothetical protein
MKYRNGRLTKISCLESEATLLPPFSKGHLNFDPRPGLQVAAIGKSFHRFNVTGILQGEEVYLPPFSERATSSQHLLKPEDSPRRPGQHMPPCGPKNSSPPAALVWQMPSLFLPLQGWITIAIAWKLRQVQLPAF